MDRLVHRSPVLEETTTNVITTRTLTIQTGIPGDHGDSKSFNNSNGDPLLKNSVQRNYGAIPVPSLGEEETKGNTTPIPDQLGGLRPPIRHGS